LTWVLNEMVRKLSDNQSERKRNIKSEEADLWAEITGDVKPLDGSHKAVAPTVVPKITAKLHKRGLGSIDVSVGANSGSIYPPVSTASQLPIKKTVNSEPVSLDRKNMRRIGKGRITIDDRIDLHGMRQSEAHRALLRFLRNAQLEQFKTVLVITGKGRLKTERSENWMDDRDVGVLRREVPDWLKSDELQDIVLGFSNALPQHGGSGALYVRLRRAR